MSILNVISPGHREEKKSYRSQCHKINRTKRIARLLFSKCKSTGESRKIDLTWWSSFFSRPFKTSSIFRFFFLLSSLLFFLTDKMIDDKYLIVVRLFTSKFANFDFVLLSWRSGQIDSRLGPHIDNEFDTVMMIYK